MQMDSDTYSAQRMNKIWWIVFWAMLALLVLFIIAYVLFILLFVGAFSLPFLMAAGPPPRRGGTLSTPHFVPPLRDRIGSELRRMPAGTGLAWHGHAVRRGAPR